MRLVTPKECEDWVRECCPSLHVIGSHKLELPKPFARLQIREIAESRRSMFYLSKMFVEWVAPFESCLLWITEYGIWPSSESQLLFARYRSSFHDSRTVAEAPGHIAEADETDEVSVALALALLFGWGGHLIGTPLKRLLTFDHDGGLSLLGKDGLHVPTTVAAELGLNASKNLVG